MRANDLLSGAMDIPSKATFTRKTNSFKRRIDSKASALISRVSDLDFGHEHTATCGCYPEGLPIADLFST